MEKFENNKSKKQKVANKSKSTKKKKSDGPSCSLFLAELTRKLTHKKKQQHEAPKNIVQTIIDSLTNALPVKLSRKTPPKRDSPIKIETLKTYAPELLPSDTIEVSHNIISTTNIPIIKLDTPIQKTGFKIPKMPLTSSDIFKSATDKRTKVVKEDVSVNTGGEHDVAAEIAKHVGTLKKISLIAEEFNQKTAKNLKEIVDSVQEDLLKKLEEIQAEQRAPTSKTEM